MADVIQWPMLVVDGGSHLHWANRAGMTLLAARRGLQLTTGHRVVPTQADHETHWQPALRRAASRRTSLWHAGLRATLLPLRGTAFSDASIELPMRAVILAGALPVAPDVLDDLSVAMGLTSAEREVLALLLAGQSPASIAEARQVRISTVRSQVRGLLTKVGVGSIREMVAVLAVLPAIGD
ncbi:MAG: helix-turn-helix transcriptional regulator [Burkholderiaceae bacterium]